MPVTFSPICNKGSVLAPVPQPMLRTDSPLLGFSRLSISSPSIAAAH